MQYLYRKAHLWALLFGGLIFFSVNHSIYILGWICLIPLLTLLLSSPVNTSFKIGLFAGIGISIFGFYWMIPGAERFTGHSIIYGILVFLTSTLVMSLYMGAFSYSMSLLIRSFKRHAINLFLKGIFIACVATIFGCLLMFISKHFPWFDFHMGNSIANNIYVIQNAEYFGIHILTFVVVLVNYLIAEVLVSKKWHQLIIPICLAIIFHLTGYYTLSSFNSYHHSNTPQKSINIAIISENLPPETRWNDHTGNMLAQNLLALTKNAADLKPDMMLWSESAIPWTYSKDDDLLHAILNITKPAKVSHVLGMNTEFQQSEVYNSAYSLLPDGTVAGRYDKQVLLSLIEAPVGSYIFPFLSTGGSVVKSGTSNQLPINTPYGKAGIMICNEATVPTVIYDQVQKGAGYILNLSNDGWFSNTYIAELHFLNARLRAVETRKDAAINSNQGYSGLVKASGEVSLQKRSNDPFVERVTIQSNTYKTLVAEYPYLFVYVCLVGLSLYILLHLWNKQKIIL